LFGPTEKNRTFPLIGRIRYFGRTRRHTRYRDLRREPQMRHFDTRQFFRQNDSKGAGITGINDSIGNVAIGFAVSIALRWRRRDSASD
jgi:hypothetical protein